MNLYPNLTIGIAVRGIKKCAIAKSIGITEKTLSNKLQGKTPFTWPEACLLQEGFFPDIEKDTLFAHNDHRVYPNKSDPPK